MSIFIPSGSYTYDASEKTLTLTGDFTTITAERIISIRNLTRKTVLYDREQLYNGALSMTGSTISGLNDSSAAADADKIQIEIDTVLSSIPILVNNVPVLAAIDTIYTAQNFPKSPDAGYTLTPAALDTRTVRKLSIACSNAGSTSLTIQVNGKNTAAGTMKIPLYTLTLNTTTTTTGGCIITDLPPYVELTVTNNDVNNAGTVTITAQKFS
jgi:hypothetical protein